MQGNACDVAAVSLYSVIECLTFISRYLIHYLAGTPFNKSKVNGMKTSQFVKSTLVALVARSLSKTGLHRPLKLATLVLGLAILGLGVGCSSATGPTDPVTASEHVVLEVVGGMNGGCGPAQLDFVRIMSDGTAQSGAGGLGWRVPTGQALVITDVDWQYVDPQGAAGAGKIEVLRLSIENLSSASNTRRAFESTITLSSQGQGGISEAMTSGFVVSSAARICPDIFPGPLGPPSGLQHLILRGYLIADN